jgi:ABC-type sugar transport system permease subunit
MKAFWWIYDSQFSILSRSLMKLGVMDGPINFLGDPENARASVIAANVWRGIPSSLSRCSRAADHPVPSGCCE